MFGEGKMEEITALFWPRYKPVDLARALKHCEGGWGDRVDWDKNLTADEVEYVTAHFKYFRGSAKVLFQRRAICDSCGATATAQGDSQVVLYKCRGYEPAHYCGAACHRADWMDHKEACLRMKAMRNGQPHKEPLQVPKTEKKEDEKKRTMATLLGYSPARCTIGYRATPPEMRGAKGDV